jgi:hypothetical protein
VKATIDRIEGSMAVLISCEDESVHLTLPVSLLPDGSREGDIVTLTVGRDDVATLAAKERVSSLVERLRKK